MNRALVSLIEVAAAACLLFGVMTVANHWPLLPDTVPIHFGLSGKPDGFGSKLWLLAMPALSIVTYTALSIGQALPDLSSTPWKITEENRERQHSLFRQLLIWLKLETVAMFSYLQWAMVKTALGQAEGVGVWFFPLIMLVLVATVAVYFYRGYQAR